MEVMVGVDGLRESGSPFQNQNPSKTDRSECTVVISPYTVTWRCLVSRLVGP